MRQIIDNMIMETGKMVHEDCEETIVANFLHMFMSRLCLKIFVAAPDDMEAKKLMNRAIRDAELTWLENKDLYRKKTTE